MTKEVVITILNLHGVDALYEIIGDELIKASDVGYDIGYSAGFDAGYDFRNNEEEK